MNFGRTYYPPVITASVINGNKTKTDELEGKIIEGIKIDKKIDEGAFGKIYKGTSLKTGNEVAIKFESIHAQHPQLISQCKLYEQIHNNPGACDLGFPRVFSCGMQGSYNYLVMDLMGESLQNLLSKSHKKFSLKTVLMLIDQMIILVQYLHQRQLLHRDIKPDNFCMGYGDRRHKLYMLDFGLAKTYITKNKKHIPFKQGKSLTGTARYASVHTHNGIQQSRRDDMESIGYVALYLLKGSLPWQGYKSNNKFDKYYQIKKIKSEISLDDLCKGVHPEFNRYLSLVRQLDFEERPKYNELRQIFKDLFKKLDFKWDYQYDWTSSTNGVKKQLYTD